MTFTVTYRDRSGAKREEAVEASSRGAVIAIVKARGISPMAIRTGGIDDSKVHVTPPWGRIGAILGISVIIGGVAWWLGGSAMMHHSDEMPLPAKPSPNRAAPKLPPPSTNKTSTASDGGAAGTNDGYRVIQTPLGEKRVKPRYSKAILDALSCADVPPIQDLRPPPPDPNAPPPPPPRYKNNLQIQLSEYAWSGKFVGVPDPMSDKEARRLVEEKVDILPDDSPEVRQEKETVAAMQEELKEYLAKGGHANDYFMELMKRQDSENETIREARRQIRELCDAGDVELAEQARDKFNEYLKGKGLPPIIMANYLKRAKKKAELKTKDGK